MLTTQTQIYDFLLAKRNWIEKNLLKFAELESQFQVPQMVAGAEFPFLGEMKYLQFAHSLLKRIYFTIEDGFLVCYLPKGARLEDFGSDELFQQLKKFYKRQAEICLTMRVQFWTQRTGLQPRKLSFRAPKTRWGSCSSRGHISLNWKLICQPISLIDYVIAHELCHLVHMNHSETFWELLETFLPNYQDSEQVLKKQERLGVFLK